MSELDRLWAYIRALEQRVIWLEKQVDRPKLKGNVDE